MDLVLLLLPDVNSEVKTGRAEGPLEPLLTEVSLVIDVTLVVGRVRSPVGEDASVEVE